MPHTLPEKKKRKEMNRLFFRAVFFFRAVLSLQKNLAESTLGFHIPSYPHPQHLHTVFPIINILS